MAQMQQTWASPATGCSIAYRVMDDAVSFHLANADPATARKEIADLAKRLFFYPDINEAYCAAMAKISEAERHTKLEAEQRQQQQQRDLVMTLLGAFKQGGQATANLPDNKAKATEPGELPEKLATEETMTMWLRLQEAGYIGNDYQPAGLSRTEAALLADEMATRLGIRNKWKTFEGLWNRRNMRSDYNDALDQRKTGDFRKRLKSLFSDL